MYLVKSEGQYIAFSKSQAFLVPHIERAYKFGTYIKANNFIANNARGLWANRSFDIVAVNSEVVGVAIPETDFSDLSDNIGSLLSGVDEFVGKMNAYIGHLTARLSEVDREKSDIEHKIEFSNLDAVSGYKIYKELQGVLLRRREIKNEMTRIKAIISILPSKSLYSQYEKIDKKIAGQQYTPRLRADLFTAS